MIGSFTVNAGALAAAVKYVAQWLDPKPSIPIHAGVLFEVADGSLTVSGFSENVTARATVPVEGDAAGQFVVAGRLIGALLAAVLAKPATFSQDGESVTMVVGRFESTLQVMPTEDYPTLGEVAEPVGTAGAAEFAEAVKRVAPAASTDLETRVALAGLHIEFGDTLRLMATDTYRATMLWIDWAGPKTEGASALAWAAGLDSAVDAFVGPDDVVIGYEPGRLSLSIPGRVLIVREFDQAEYPAEALPRLLNAPGPVAVEFGVRALLAALKPIDLLHDEKDDAVRLALAPGLATLRAQGQTKGGNEEMDVAYDGEEFEVTLKSSDLRAALAGAPGAAVTASFTPNSLKNVVFTCQADPTWRYLIRPLKRLDKLTNPKGTN